MITEYIVYVLEDEKHRITSVDSSAFVPEGWGIEIDRGTGDRYHHAQGNYFPGGLYTSAGIPRYKLVDSQAKERTEEEIAADRAAIPPVHPSRTSQMETAVMAFAAAAVEIKDALALQMPDLFPSWEDVLAAGKKLPAGRILQDKNQLYRVMQAVTPLESQPPGGEGMLAVYRPIDQQHAGTAKDPIPFVCGMDCRAGLYYSYEGKTWLCKADMIPCTWPPDTPGMWQWEETA